MHLRILSASLGSAFATIPSNSVTASAVGIAYNNDEKQLDINSPSAHGEECSFVTSLQLKRPEADTGILGCKPNYVCVEDSLSSLGGRCVMGEKVHRHLQNTPACTAKCTGTDACRGLSQDFIDNNIGDKSCCGEEACADITGKFESTIILKKEFSYKAQDLPVICHIIHRNHYHRT